jgi:hypothetical protein
LKTEGPNGRHWKRTRRTFRLRYLRSFAVGESRTRREVNAREDLQDDAQEWESSLLGSAVTRVSTFANTQDHRCISRTSPEGGHCTWTIRFSCQIMNARSTSTRTARLRQLHSPVGELAADLKMAHGAAGVSVWSTNIQLTSTYLNVKQGGLQASMRQATKPAPVATKQAIEQRPDCNGKVE